MSLNDLNVLLIAYACEPNRGSEPAVGFNWSLALSKYCNVTVLTRKNNKRVIEEYLQKNSIHNIKFIYFDIPILSKLKNYLPFGIKLYSFLWEYFSYSKICNYKFDVIQRLTFVNLITVNRYYRLCKYYINGFLGGGEQSPKSILDNYPLRFKLLEKLRYSTYTLLLNSHIVKVVYKNSKLLLAVTLESKSLINRYHKNENIFVIPAISHDGKNQHSINELKNEFKLMYAGRLIYWKNVDIIIKALGLLHKHGYKFKLDIVGEGPDKNRLRRIVSELGLSEWVYFKGLLKQDILFEEYKNHSLFVFASSHDSGGMVVIEAISMHLPVLFLDTGGPKEIFDGINYPLKVNPNQKYQNIINEYAEKIIWFYNNYEEFMLSFGVIKEKILEQNHIDFRVQKIINLYQKYIYL